MNLSLIDNNPAFVKLKKDVQNNSLNHAYLIVSEDKEARLAFYKKASMAILCPSGGCGECDVCNSIINNSHLDIMFLDASNKLKVTDIATLINDTLVRPTQGDKKLYFIDNAELLSVAIQNKLLKTYEDPTSFVTIFLGASNTSSILKTIQSRAKRLNMGVLSTEEIFADLIDDGIEPDIARASAVFSIGNITKARLFAENPEYKRIFDEVFELLGNIKKSSEIINYVTKDIFNKDNLSLTLDFFEIILLDCLKIRSESKAKLFTINREFDINKIAKTFSSAGLSMSIIAINDARKRLSSNINALSVSERMLFDILEARYKW